MPSTYYAVFAVELGSARTGIEEQVAYKVLDENGVLIAGPTNTNVRESEIPGNYYVRGGAPVPINSKGRAVWSADSGTSYLAERAYDFAIVEEQITALQAATDDGVSPGMS